MLAYGLSFGLLSAMASIANALGSAFHEADFFRTPVPQSNLGFSDYTGVVWDARNYFLFQALPTSGIILLCVAVGAFLAARTSRQFASGMSVAFTVFPLGFIPYVIACAAIATYLLQPAYPFDEHSLLAYSLVENTIAGLILIAPTTVVGIMVSALGAGG
jgi:hypothetical protein